jgi:predicted ester cyclase
LTSFVHIACTPLNCYISPEYFSHQHNVPFHKGLSSLLPNKYIESGILSQIFVYVYSSPFICELYTSHQCKKKSVTIISKLFIFFSEDGPGKGGEGIKQFLADFFNAFHDDLATIEHIVEENNLVVVFLNGSGMHEGEFHGVQPTNKQVSIRSADLYIIENGIITGHWELVDQLDLLKQTGGLLSENVNEDCKDTRIVWIRDYA